MRNNFKLGLLAAVSVIALTHFSPARAAPETATPQASGMSYTEASASNAGASERGAFDFIKMTTDKGLKFLANPNATHEQKTADFRKLLDASFDLDTIGRFALGKYWNGATQAQRNEYLKLFRKMVVDVYSNRFEEYKGQRIEVRSFRLLDPSKNDTLVTSYLIPPKGGEEVRVDWRVRHKGGGYKIVDVLVAGVSMSVTQRSDFASVIQRGGGNVDALLAELNGGKVAKK